jgi:hypothetical protein
MLEATSSQGPQRTEVPAVPASVDEEACRAWGRILDIFFEQLMARGLPLYEARRVSTEIELLLKAVRGKKGTWASVVDVALQLLREDRTVHEMYLRLGCAESTIYRALRRLEQVGFATQMDSGRLNRPWTLNRTSFPILHRLTRGS